VFPLYEVDKGRYKMTVEVPELRPVEEYLKPQGRFRHLTPELIAEIQARVKKEYDKLQAKASML
jgi:pyruvate ferredoxin oxidoreductase beta subunit